MKRRVDRACPLDGSPRPHHFRGHCHCQCHLGFGRHPWTAGVRTYARAAKARGTHDSDGRDHASAGRVHGSRRST